VEQTRRYWMQNSKYHRGAKQILAGKELNPQRDSKGNRLKRRIGPILQPEITAIERSPADKKRHSISASGYTGPATRESHG